MINKLFLYSCTLIALFITGSGFASVRHASELILHVLFIPVTLYLLYASVMQLRNPRKTIAVQLASHTRAIMSIFFFLFVVIIAKMISIVMIPI